MQLAYHLAKELKHKEGNAGSSSELTKEKSLWNLLWHLNVPLRVKIFLWKASNDILATRLNIQKIIKKLKQVVSKM